MKLLFLGGSSESPTDAGGVRRHEILAEILTKEIGQPVEIEPVRLWPNHRLPGYVERAIKESNPDLIYFHIVDYAIAYPSTPIRLAHLGPPGRWLANRSLLFADSPAAHNAPVRALRYLLQATVGGEPHVPVEQGIANFLEAIRIAARQEGTFTFVGGPLGQIQWGTTSRQHRQGEATRLRLHHALRNTCETLHVPYFGYDTPAWADPNHPRHRGNDEVVGDGVHNNDLGARLSAERHARIILAAYREHTATHG